MVNRIELVHISEGQRPLRVSVAYYDGMTVANVLEQSGLLERHPELQGLPAGIFSKIVELGTLVKLGDRVELYRPLQLDPMEKRRQRAKKKRRL